MQPLATSYLDFGMTRGSKRTCCDYREGQRAYELFMGARRLSDVIAYREGNLDDIDHPEDVRDQLRKYIALSVCRRHSSRLTYYEVGSSAMGVIDGMEFLNRTYHDLRPEQITWLGTDTSRFMNAMARYTHHGYDIRLSETTAAVPCDVFFATGASLLHAIDTEELLCDVLAQSRISLFDYTFATAGHISDYVDTGLPVTFLNLAECRRRLDIAGKTLILNPDARRSHHRLPDKATFDCVYGDEAIVCEYLEELEHRVTEFADLWQRPLVPGSRAPVLV